MKTRLFGILVLLLTVCIAPAQDDGDAPPKSDAAGAQIAQTPEFKAFMDAYIAARNSKDRAKVDALYDPASRALMTKTLAENPQVAALFTMIMYSPIPEKHEIAVQVIPPDAPLPLAKMGVTYAVRPELHVFLSSSPNPNESSTEELFLAKSGDQWLKVFNTFPKENTGETGATAVATSAISDYTYNPTPQDDFEHVHTWEVQLNAADSKSGPYEIDQITYGSGDKPETGDVQTLVDKDSTEPNKDGFVDFEVGIGGKKPPKPFGEGVNIPLSFNGHGTGRFASFFVELPGPTIDDATASPKGTQMSGGQMLLMRYNVTGKDGAKSIVDIVLRHPPGAAPALTVAEAQKEAVAKYPDLGSAGTPLHAKFLELYQEAKADGSTADPAWPLLLALRASSLLASGTTPAWYQLEAGRTYICDFELQPGGSRGIDLPSTKPVIVGFNTSITFDQGEQIDKLKGLDHLPKLSRRNGHPYIASTYGGSMRAEPAGNIVPLRATNNTSIPVKFVIYLKTGGSH